MTRARKLAQATFCAILPQVGLQGNRFVQAFENVAGLRIPAGAPRQAMAWRALGNSHVSAAERAKRHGNYALICCSGRKFENTRDGTQCAMAWRTAGENTSASPCGRNDVEIMPPFSVRSRHRRCRLGVYHGPISFTRPTPLPAGASRRRRQTWSRLTVTPSISPSNIS